MTNWHDRLLRLKQELAEVRAVRQRRTNEEEAELARERDDLSRLADGLGTAGLLADMNATLLDGRGRVETVVGWEDETVEGMIDLSSPSLDLRGRRGRQRRHHVGPGLGRRRAVGDHRRRGTHGRGDLSTG